MTSALAFPVVNMSDVNREHLNDSLVNECVLREEFWPEGIPVSASCNHVYTGRGGSRIAQKALDGTAEFVKMLSHLCCSHKFPMQISSLNTPVPKALP
jgi:hypothetical protein